MARVKLGRSVWNRFGGVVAVEDLSVDAGESPFTVFVGPSGWNKTTTLRIIVGLAVATAECRG